MTVGYVRTSRPTREQRRLELMRRGSAATNKYSIGGVEKKGGYKPRPITLPTIKMPILEED